jgi:hypothetical protein
MANDTSILADAIEEDIRNTQDQMGDTIEALEERLSPPQVARSVLGSDGGDILKDAIEITRRNPIPVALIAVGVIWLLADSRTGAARKLSRLLSPPDAGRPTRHNPTTTTSLATETSYEMPR